MKTWNAVKLYGIMGLSLGAASACASSHGTTKNNDSKIISTDTLRVAHVRYTPERDYINLELIKNGQPTEEYTEITAAPESETTFFGDTVLIHHGNNFQKIINISAQRRARQK